MAQRKDVTIQTIAEQCGVSTATVSRVLNNDRRVSEKTRSLVREALEAQHYVMPAALERSPRVGLIIDSELSDYYMALTERVHEHMKRAGMRVIMISLDHNPDELPDCLDTVYDCGTSGVVLVSCPYRSIRERLNPSIPHVWIDCNDVPEDTRDICQVQSDQYYSGMIAARELWKKGCDKPLILTGYPATHRALERERGFREEFAAHGVEVGDERIVRSDSTIRDILTETKQIISYKVYQKFPFDSVFAVSDWRALGAYLALDELSLRVPEDVKIIGYDGVSAVSRSALRITSVQQNIDRIAQSACTLLLRMQRGEIIDERRVIVPTDILPGKTV